MTEFDELLVTTGVDALVKLVKERGRVELEECSKELKIDSSTLEEWASVLEEEGIIRVEYKLAKVYLVWVTPTEEEIAIERESFYKEKAELEKEIAAVKGKVTPQIEEIATLRDSFEKFYKDVYKKLEEMEKKISPGVATGAISEKKFEEDAEKINEMLQNIKLLRDGITALKEDVRTAEEAIKESKTEKLFERVKQLEKEIPSLLSEMTELKKKMAAEMEEVSKGVSLPSAVELKKKLDGIMEDFKEVKKRNAALAEDLRNLQESTEIVNMVGKELKDYEKNTANLKKELSELSKQADSLFKKSKDIDDKLKENLETIERFSDSLEIAKTIVTKFPSQKKLSDELKELSKKEAIIEEKTTALRRLTELMGGKQLSAKRTTEIAEEVEKKLSELRAESEQLMKSLEADKSTYLTFQHVKEKVVPSIEKYNNEVARLEKELERIKESASIQQQQLREEAKKFKQTVKEGEISSMVAFAESINEKKKALDEIRNSLASLAESADNLNKRIVLLSRQASLLELRTEKAAEAAEKEAVVKEQLRLTEAEELEFRKKREELKKLIKKLWEEQ